jgi:hypothetical protein
MGYKLAQVFRHQTQLIFEEFTKTRTQVNGLCITATKLHLPYANRRYQLPCSSTTDDI